MMKMLLVLTGLLSTALAEPRKVTDTMVEGTEEELFAILASDQELDYKRFKLANSSEVVIIPTADKATIGSRSVPQCTAYYKYQATQVQSWWNSWTPVSSCLYTGEDSQGGSESIQYGFTITAQTGISIGADGIADLINAAIDVDVSYSYSVSDTFECNIPGNSVGQIWSQQYVYWSYIEEQTCNTCTGCGSWVGQGGASAPKNNDFSLGCSTGSSKVQCNASNNVQIYS